MKSIRLKFGLPLLVKDLTEQAARRRTYVIRVIYAGLLLLFGMLYLSSIMRHSGGNFMNVLGAGSGLFELVVMLQFGGIYLFGPAIMVGCITQEKERQTFSLLLLTELRPWEILLQKLLSRLIPMLMFVLLSLPLIVLAYGFGGVSTARLIAAGVLLPIAAVQLACLCMMMSAWCRSTTGAFIGTYLLGATLAIGPAIVALITWEFGRVRIGWMHDEDVIFALCPPFHFEAAKWGQQRVLYLQIAPIAVSAVVFLILARVAIVRRAMLPPKDVMLAVFRGLDRFWQKLNSVSGGVVLLRDAESLPGNRPVAWREVTKKALGKPHYLFRILVATIVPVFVVIACLLTFSDTRWQRSQAEELSVVLLFLWPLALLFIVTVGASTFATERSRQTLDVLLSTPMTGSQIVNEKTAALRRLMWVLAVPFAMVFIAEAWWEHGVSNGYRENPTWAYLAGSLLSLLIYMPLMGWLAVWIGLRSKRPARAVVTALGVVAGWIVLPPIVAVFIQEMWRWDNTVISWMMMLSPVSMIGFQEFNEYSNLSASPWFIVALNFTWYGTLFLLLRYLCLNRADRYLERV